MTSKNQKESFDFFESLPTPSLAMQNKLEIQDKDGENFIIF